jgi:hypothetical protein
MTFVKQVGERYLWVDALCLVQDHPEKIDLLDSMDKVYSAAAWCLVAASAKDANSPLHRVVRTDSEAYQERKYSVRIQGLELGTVLPPLPTALDTSMWSKRAWTYQEGVLARRLLFVFDDQLFFHCCHGHTYSEDVAFEGLEGSAGRNTQLSGQIYHTHAPTNFEIYAKAVEEYVSRDLSFLDGVIKAFKGVMSNLSSAFRGAFLYGLPDTEIDQALLWQPLTNVYRRPRGGVESGFPTWSWAGWVGRVGYRPNLVLSRVKWKDCENKYFTSNQFRRPTSVHDGDAWIEQNWTRGNPNFDREEPWAHDFCYYEKGKPDKLFLHPVSSMFNSVYERLEGFRAFNHHYMDPNSQRLTFRCMSTMLTLTGEHADFESEYHELCTAGQHHVCALKIYDSAHHLAGTVQIPGSAAEGLQAGKQEFICLSRTHLSGDMTDASEMHPFDDEFDDVIEAEAG